MPWNWGLGLGLGSFLNFQYSVERSVMWDALKRATFLKGGPQADLSSLFEYVML